MDEKKENKYIAGIKAKVQKKIDALRKEANEAYFEWADTGYQRYMNKKERLEAEADELECFIHPEYDNRRERNKADRLEAEKEELKLLLKQVGNVVEQMKGDFPDCWETRRLEDIVNTFKFEHLNK